MSFSDLFNKTWILFQPYFYQVLLSVILLLVFYFIIRFIVPKIDLNVSKSRLPSENAIKAAHTIRIISVILIIGLLLLIWGIDFSGLLLLSTSILTLTGVALFASWSLLSNITAFLILIFHISFRRGNFIRIIDSDNYIEGYISEIGLFNTRLITEDRESVVYPNNILISRPIIVNPRVKLQKIGKISNEINLDKDPLA